MYPPKAGFQLHHDSKYRWGEVIVGVNLGQEGEMLFTPDNPKENAFHHAAFTSEFASKSAGVHKSMRVKLPRRSIYIMSGPSRYVYKHGIAQQRPTRPPPSWNKWNMRKSLTFRSTKVFSDVYLERQLNNTTNTTTTERMEWQRRKEEQDKYKAKGTKVEVAQERQNATLLLNMMDSGIIPSQLRFDRSEVTFDLAPGVVVQQQQQQHSEYRGYSSSQFGSLGIGGGDNIVSAAAPVAATAAFQGEGRQLGSTSINHSRGDDDDDVMQMAINASLRSLDAERAARSEKRKRMNRSSDECASESCKEEEGASAKKRSGGAAGTSCEGVIDLVGEGDSDDDEEETKNEGFFKKDRDIIAIE